MSESAHIPVMVEESLKALAVQPGGRYIDCTLGAGGHSAGILERSSPGGQLLGIDGDPHAIAIASETLKPYRDSFKLVNDNFSNLESICYRNDFTPVHGILFDLGLSTMQLDDPERGFSFQHNGPLDMRQGPEQELTAADIVNKYPEAELSSLIRTYGEENFSGRIARRIVQERPISTAAQLAQVIERAVGGRKGSRIHPATKTFQALRIAVNRELENLKSALKQAVNMLGFEGRLVVISYHSLEDRIVKQFMQEEARDCVCPPSVPVCICGHKARLKILNRRVITPTEEEIQANPRSRSAKLRAAERIVPHDDRYDAIEQMVSSKDASLTNSWRKPSFLREMRAAFGNAA